MLPIQRKISPYNHYNGNDIKYIVIHYIGATGTAKNNADYFYGGDRQASAHYFVGLNEIWQSVEDYNGAWHVGNTRTEVNNKNSIGIEMECANPNLYVEDQTIQNTCELVAYLMKKYNIPLANVRTHYEVSGKTKICPNFANTSRWTDMKNKIQLELNKLNGNTSTSKPSQSTTILYRVKKSNGEQLGAFASLENAKSLASKNQAIVYDSNGKVVISYVPQQVTDEVSRYAEKGTFYPNTTINFRNAPSTDSSNPVQGQYFKGESVNYDTVVIGKRYNWISWISGSGVRRYMPIRDKQTGEPMWGRAV